MRKRLAAIGLGSAALAVSAGSFWPVTAGASETITYVYDARGRLIEVQRSGTINNGVSTTYQIDKADNRLSKTTSGSGNPPPP